MKLRYSITWTVLSKITGSVNTVAAGLALQLWRKNPCSRSDHGETALWLGKSDDESLRGERQV
ncbi:MAG: hypothetical protein KC592_13275 [Nitrospira sp.]|nr:hypothetical protein [Nitrospira sp.]